LTTDQWNFIRLCLRWVLVFLRRLDSPCFSDHGICFKSSGLAMDQHLTQTEPFIKGFKNRDRLQVNDRALRCGNRRVWVSRSCSAPFQAKVSIASRLPLPLNMTSEVVQYALPPIALLLDRVSRLAIEGHAHPDAFRAIRKLDTEIFIVYLLRHPSHGNAPRLRTSRSRPDRIADALRSPLPRRRRPGSGSAVPIPAPLPGS